MPKSFIDLVNNLSLLPGVGTKTAERYVYYLYENNFDEIDDIVNSLLNFKKNIKQCEVCGCLSDNDVCDICRSDNRNLKTICVVEDSKSVFYIEKTGKYNGYYHVLGGLISPRDGKNPENLNISSLINKRINENVEEIIIALNPSIEGEITSSYIQKILSNKSIKISRLSYGIPIGTDIEYLDPIMISKALDDRKVIS